MTGCEIVLQYACEDTLDPTKKYRGPQGQVGAPRDGTPKDDNDAATDRIKEDDQSAVANTPQTRRFGMHEGIDYYKAAKQRPRNGGLYTADQNVQGRKGALATRQNPNGNRRGLEVPEERDYYPYWDVSPWRDIAVITNNPERCEYYKRESANVKPRSVCVPGAGGTDKDGCPNGKVRKLVWWDPSHPKTRQANRQLLAESGKSGDQWTEVTDLKDQDWLEANEPKDAKTVDCVNGKSSSSRENHLGNARETSNPDPAIPHGVNPSRYIWTIPDHAQKDCVLRLRYNISTSDYWAWDNEGTPKATSADNERRRRPGSSPVVQDPYLGLGDDGQSTFLSLAVNTNQYGRTFQDRSYVFEIRQRPAAMANAEVYNLGVRGKRGNIVQVYPAVEYDFVPNDLCINQGDYVHFQWTGSDYNPRRNPNDAEGAGDLAENRRNRGSRADRSNLVDQDLMPKTPIGKARNRRRRRPQQQPQLGATDNGQHAGEVAAGTNYPAGSVTSANWKDLGKNYKGMFWTPQGQPDKAAIMKMAFLNQHANMKQNGQQCLTLAQLGEIRKNNDRERDPRNCAKLNGAMDRQGTRTPYFDGGAMKMNKAGAFSYMSTRNNNFSNRNQVGFMCVNQNNQCKANGGCRGMVENQLLEKLESENKGKLSQQNLIEDKQAEKSLSVAQIVSKARELLGDEAASKLSQGLDSI